MLVPLQSRSVVGVILAVSPLPSDFQVRSLKAIESILETEPIVTSEQIELARFVADYYRAPLGEVIRLCLPPNTPRSLKAGSLPQKRKKPSARRVLEPAEPILLNFEQEQALQTILGPQKTFLLEGVTGSGKTEVYIHTTQSMLDEGKSVLVVVPEIGLTPQLKDRFEQQLGKPVCMLHSGLSHSQRDQALTALRTAQVRIAIGARSAIFAPLPNLGLIVVDEEHDPSFKQEESPRYQARDIALWRAKNENAKIILGSATPSLESINNVQKGLIAHIALKNRAISTSFLPQVELVDLKGVRSTAKSSGQSRSILSPRLLSKMRDTIAQGNQVLLFLNRRGYSSLAVCDFCGQQAHCPSCSVCLTLHYQEQLLRCHLCDYQSSPSQSCSHCQEGPVLYLGIGTERVEEEVRLHFPKVPVARLDRDTAKTSQRTQEILNQLHDGEAQILIGTQMIAKGHDFERLTLVGVVLADLGLSAPDFRASERTFQLLIQVAGRAGRRSQSGTVIIQTFNPENKLFENLVNHNITNFNKNELAHRKSSHQPPFVRGTLIRFESTEPLGAEQKAYETAEKITQAIHTLGLKSQAQLLGPAKAPIEKLRNRWRWQLYLKTSNHQTRTQILDTLRLRNTPKLRIVIDIDPQQFS